MLPFLVRKTCRFYRGCSRFRVGLFAGRSSSRGVFFPFFSLFAKLLLHERERDGGLDPAFYSSAVGKGENGVEAVNVDRENRGPAPAGGKKRGDRRNKLWFVCKRACKLPTVDRPGKGTNVACSEDFRVAGCARGRCREMSLPHRHVSARGPGTFLLPGAAVCKEQG